MLTYCETYNFDMKHAPTGIKSKIDQFYKVTKLYIKYIIIKQKKSVCEKNLKYMQLVADHFLGIAVAGA